MKTINRRLFLQGAVATGIAGCSRDEPTQTVSQTSSNDAWEKANSIVRNTVVPTFSNRDVIITEYGAVANDRSDASKAIQSAIQACHAAGGGRVIVPPGEFYTGPIHLESNINLHIEEGATLKFFTDPKRYLPAVFTRWEGIEHMGYSPLIYAFQKTNVAITGKGTLDGQANRTTWWPWKGNKEWHVEGFPTQQKARTAMFNDAENGVSPSARHYADGAFLRPPFIQPYQCKNVLIEDIRVIQAPFWLLHPTLCENVTVRGVHLESLGPNSDGCDPESCKNVVIENCYFDTGDDCIAIKSGRNADGRRLATPTENVVIRNCKMRAGHGGIVIGSEISGGVRHVYAENNEMSSPDLDRGLRIKTNSVRGGLLEHLYYRNNTIGRVKDAIVINFYYEEGDNGDFDPTVRHVFIENLKCGKADRVFNIRGFKRAPIQNLNLTDCEFIEADEAGIIENVDELNVDNVTINQQEFSV